MALNSTINEAHEYAYSSDASDKCALPDKQHINNAGAASQRETYYILTGRSTFYPFKSETYLIYNHKAFL